ncbi:MAG: hypothetical protein MUF56_07125, partial [Solirubrobacteraceae bacterium]|nr:hypothetical protein [Solirubrobacteraceae bacterium]
GGGAGRARGRLAAPEGLQPAPVEPPPAPPGAMPGATQVPFGGINPPVFTPGDGTVILPGVNNPPAP